MNPPQNNATSPRWWTTSIQASCLFALLTVVPALAEQPNPLVASLGPQSQPLRTENTSLELSAPELARPATATPSGISDSADRFWLISTRSLPSSVRCAPLESPNFRVSEMDVCGRAWSSRIDEYLSSRSSARAAVVYVHGNRIDTSSDAIRRSLSVYRDIRRYRYRHANGSQPIDWIIWSWPSQRESIALKDVRIKAARTDTQGLYLAWLLREHSRFGQPTALVGYSFGGRIVTGALHALAGGSLANRRLPGDTIQGASIDVGLVAPALENDWLARGGYHSLATKNLDSLRLLYNRRDVVLKNYWRLDRIRNADALGYSGPTRFSPRVDGTRLPVTSRDCAAAVGTHHSELDYYNSRCGGGALMHQVIASSLIPDA